MDLRAIESTGHLATAMYLSEGLLQSFLSKPGSHLEKIAIKRKRGSKRPRVVWDVTNDEVKTGLRTLAQELDRFLREFVGRQYPHPAAFGYVQSRSAFKNAEVHAGAKQLLSADVREFFPSIRKSLVETELLKHGFHPKGARLIAQVVTLDGGLAVGYPTSPLISNVVMLPRDEDFTTLAKDYNARYSRYADDITFSTAAKHGSLPSKEEIVEILSKSGLPLHESKFVYRKEGQSLYVTGYSVSAPTPRIPKATKKRLRAWLHKLKTKRLRDLRTGHTAAKLGAMIPGLIAYVASAEKNLAKTFEKQWAERHDANGAVGAIPRRRKRPREVTLVFDDSKFTVNGRKFVAIGTAKLHNAPVCAAMINEEVAALRLSRLTTVQLARELAESGLHFTALTEDFRRDVVELLARMPVTGHIAYQELDSALTQKAQLALLATILSSSLKHRLEDSAGAVLTLVFERGDYVKQGRIDSEVKALVNAMDPAIAPIRIADVRVVSKLEDPCVNIPDIFMGAWQHYAQANDPQRSEMSQRDALLFQTIQPRLGTIFDMRTRQVFTKRNPFTPFLATSSAAGTVIEGAQVAHPAVNPVVSP